MMTTGRPTGCQRRGAARRTRTVATLLLGLLLLSALGGFFSSTSAQAPAQPPGIEKINHVIVVFQENWSFDGLYGRFPGANGHANAGAAVRQVDKDGRPYQVLPQWSDPRFPADLPVAPFDAARFVGPTERTSDLVHRFYQEQFQINGGRMDKFVAWSDAGGLVMSYYDATDLPEGRLAQQFTLADNFFHAAYGGSYLNHFWLVCACTPVWRAAPAERVAQLDPSGMLMRDGDVTPDGFSVNTTQPRNPPFAAGTPDAQRLPPQTMPTIGDRLNDAGISWAWYAGGWNDAVAGRPNPLFQFHHQPFNYFANYATGQPARAEHLKDTDDFFAALRNDTLPAVSFVKLLGADNEHPGYADLQRGQQSVADLVAAVQASPLWKDTAIIITYDENGGRWDHVAPPAGDRWGPATRVPAIIISPFARRAFVDHTAYDTTSILKFIETRWKVAPLGSRDAAANNLLAAFDFTQDPTAMVPDPRMMAAGSTRSHRLAPGCNNVVLSFPIGTPLRTVAQGVSVGAGLKSIFRLDSATGRFAGFSPGTADFANDYTTVTARLETVFICVSTAGTFTQPGL